MSQMSKLSGLISVENKLGRLKRTVPAVVKENHEIDTDMILSTRWMNDCLISFYDEKPKNFFTSSNPSSAVSFEWESCPRPQKIHFAWEPQAQSERLRCRDDGGTSIEEVMGCGPRECEKGSE